MALINLDTSELQRTLDNLALVLNGHQAAIDQLQITLSEIDTRLTALETGLQPHPPVGVTQGMRGMWLQNTSDPEVARARVRIAASAGANTVYWFCGVGARVRFRNTQGIPFNDVLSDVINEAHKANMAVYPCLPSKYFTRVDFPQQNLRGKGVPGCNEDWLDFRETGARALIAGLALDLAEYPIDGIILDYTRYHRNWFPAARDAGLLSDAEITETVRLVRETLPPGVLLAASPMGRLDTSPYSAFNNAQNWPAWLSLGLVDWLSPMVYQDAAFLQDRIAEWRATGHYPDRICPLLSFEKALQPPEQKYPNGWRAELQAALDSGARGIAVFDEALANRYPELVPVLREMWARL